MSDETIRLWPDVGDEASLTLYPLPENVSARGAVLVLPGGGYFALAPHEGESYAKALNAAGFEAAVLTYRLAPNHQHPQMIHDAQRGIRLLRRHPAIRSQRIAVMGSSAGGHLASTLAVHHDRFTSKEDDLREAVSARPDAVVLCYPVIDFAGAAAHSGSRRGLLGETPDAELVTLLSNHLHVTADSPPTFLWHTYEDAGVPVENSLLFAAACRKAGVPVECLCFEVGRHGLGLAEDLPGVRVWFDAAAAFLARHLAEQTSAS